MLVGVDVLNVGTAIQAALLVLHCSLGNYMVVHLGFNHKSCNEHGVG